MISRAIFCRWAWPHRPGRGLRLLANGRGWPRSRQLTQDQLLEFDTFGNVSLIHITDIHAQLKPIYFREPSINLGVGEKQGRRCRT